MTAESEMVSIVENATSAAYSLASSTQTLVSTAIANISDPVEFPIIPTSIIAKEIDLEGIKFKPKKTNAKSGLPRFPDIELPDLPDLVTVDKITSKFTAVLEALSISKNFVISPANAPEFLEAEPAIETNLNLPTTPNMVVPQKPTLETLTILPSALISIPPIELEQLNVEIEVDPKFFEDQLDKFNGSIFGGGPNIRGLNELLQEFSSMSETAFSSIFNDFITIIGNQLQDKYRSLLGSLDIKIQKEMMTAISDEAVRVRAALDDHSGWDLPALVRQALNATMEQSITAWSTQAESQQQTDKWEQSQDIFELSATLYDKLRKAIQELKGREIAMTLDAHSQSILYAKQITDALLIAFSTENYQLYDLEFKEAEFQLKLFEEELKINLIRYEEKFAQLEIEKAKQEQDGILVQQFQAELQQLNTENKLLSAQVNTAGNELELKSLPIEIFESNIRAFAARVNAYEAQVNALVAKINQNDAFVEIESAKMKAFEAEADGFVAKVNANKAVIQAQKQRNDSVLEELKAKVKAAMAPVDISTSKVKYELAEFETDAKEYLIDAKSKLEKAKLDDEWRREEQKGLFEAYKLTREQAIGIATKKLQLLKAVTGVNQQGSLIMAKMAGGAMSAANGIANVIFDES
jgi:hypothetical protein